MEENYEVEPSTISIDHYGQQHLAVAARWAKFLAIVGMVMCCIIVVIGFALMLMPLGPARYGYRRPFISTGALGFIYLLVSVLHFVPSLYFLQFANKLKTALQVQDSEVLNESFQKLKIVFRYLGILTISVIVLYICIILFAIIAIAVRGVVV